MRVAIVAGEASGDSLGAGLIAAIKARYPRAEFFGVAGPKMRAAGCVAWHESEEVSVMGLTEVLPHLLRLLRLRHGITRNLLAEQPDVFVGIDSPDFNVSIARTLRAAGIPTVQYVSPQIWAWRQSRVNGIRDAYDRVLCVLPFETDFYARHGVPATFVGHPLADEIGDTTDPGPARAALGIDRDAIVLGLLPGSRRSVVSRLAEPFLQTAGWLDGRIEGLRVAVALAGPALEPTVRRARRRVELRSDPILARGMARQVLAAADVVLTASGTAALEALLVKRPMVVAYKMSPLSFAIVRRMGIDRMPFYSLPNLLAGHEVAPELVQSDVRADLLGPAVEQVLERSRRSGEWREEFARIHRELRGGGSTAAADAVLAVAGRSFASLGSANAG